MRRAVGLRMSSYGRVAGIVFIVAALVTPMAGCVERPSKDLEIRDWHDLNLMRYNLGGHYALMNDLDSATGGYEELAGPDADNGGGWRQIGFVVASIWEPPPPEFHRFHGTFDGQGHEIRDLFISRTNEWGVGLFGAVTEAAVIKNLGLVAANVTGGDTVGGLVGSNWGRVSDCSVTGSVKGRRNVGGLVGVNGLRWDSGYDDLVPDPGTVSNSYSAAIVSGESSVGGLVGSNTGTVINSHYNYDQVLINGENIITVGALFADDFEEWLDSGRFLDIDERLDQEEGYYAINDVWDFKQLLAFGQDESLRFRLKNDIDLAAEPNVYIPYLAGEFDGNGHTVSNLNFDLEFISGVGLFGLLTSGGKVSGVAVENADVAGSSEVGGLVGMNSGTVSNSSSTGNVTGRSAVGGLVGSNIGLVGHYNGAVNDSCSAAIVIGESSVGGLVGANRGTVSNSFSSGNVTGRSAVGGLVGGNNGFVGYYHGAVNESYSAAIVIGESSVGGLAGVNLGTVSSSYSTGSVTGKVRVGGLVGRQMYGGIEGYHEYQGTVSDSYSASVVTGEEYVGGLVGDNEGIVSDSYAVGTASGDSYVGGLIGDNAGGTIHGSFWDVEASMIGVSEGGTGKTTAEMMNIATYTDTDTEGLDEPWDMVAVADTDQRNPAYIWNIVDGQTYPLLSWQSL